MLPVPRGHNAVLCWLSYAPDEAWSFRLVPPQRHPRYKGGVLRLNYGSESGGLPGSRAPLCALRERRVAAYACRPWWPGPDSRRRPWDYESPALYAELPGQKMVIAAGLSPATSAFAEPRSL
jgi:hypothetical protein